MKNILIICFFFFTGNMFAQANLQCGDQLIKLQLEKSYPGISSVIEETFKSAKNNPVEKVAVLKIPVVFHVIYNNDEQNLSESVLRSQLDVLNEDFRRMNANASEVRSIFEDIAADTEIEFFFAGQDPNGNYTNGITRTYTEKESFISISFDQILEAITECGFDFEDPEVAACINEFIGALGGFDLDIMKSSATGGVDAWDTKSYLNVWIANLSIDAAGTPTPFILGFAYPPTEAPNWPAGTIPDNIEAKDGVVLHYQVVGRDNPTIGALAGINDQGRTAVHEVGHYLGLRHIWGDGDCNEDDGIEDTPAAASNSQPLADFIGCEAMHTKDTCTDDMSPDMLENYMDYSIETCQNMFTFEQVALMRAMLEGPRSGLLSNQVSAVNDAFANKLIVYPNPSSGQISVEGMTKDMQIKVYDRTGSLLLKTGDHQFLFNETPGLYFIEITNQSETYFKQIIIN